MEEKSSEPRCKPALPRTAHHHFAGIERRIRCMLRKTHVPMVEYLPHHAAESLAPIPYARISSRPTLYGLQGMLTRLEGDLLSSLEYSPEMQYIVKLDSSFERLVFHGMCQFYGVGSRSRAHYYCYSPQFPCNHCPVGDTIDGDRCTVASLKDPAGFTL